MTGQKKLNTACKQHNDACWQCSWLWYLDSAIYLSASVGKLKVGLGRDCCKIIVIYWGSTFVKIGGLPAFTFTKRFFNVYSEVSYDPTSCKNEFSEQRSSVISSRSTRNYWSLTLQVSIPLIPAMFFVCFIIVSVLWDPSYKGKNSSDPYLHTSLSVLSTKGTLNLLTPST